MDRTALRAEERTILGKKVKTLRKEGKIPAHVFGSHKDVEHVSVNNLEFRKVFKHAGETGLIDLKIGDDKVRPVLIRETDYNPKTGNLVHIGFYQVNLKQKVTVPVPIVLIGEGPESIKLGDAVVLQTVSEVEVEALPGDLIEKFEVNIDVLKEIDDAITVADLNYDKEKLIILAEMEEVVVKLAPAVTEEMKALLEEQAAEAAAVTEEATVEEDGEVKEGAEVEGAEGEVTEGAKRAQEGTEANQEKTAASKE